MDEFLGLLPCAIYLALALAVGLRGGSNPVRVPLALLCADFFVWTFAHRVYVFTEVPAWKWLDVTFSPLSPVLGLHLILAFVGRVRRHRRPLRAFYIGWGTLSILSATAFISPWAHPLIDGWEWSLVYLVGLIAVSGWAAIELVHHLRRTPLAAEKARTRLVIAALAVGVVLGSTEMLNDFGLDLPDLGTLGSVLTTVLLAVASFGFRLLGRDLSVSIAVYALTLGTAVVVALLGAVQLFKSYAAVATVSTLVICSVIVVAVRELVTARVAARERTRHFESLGRMSAQMAHDLKNPLAALKGALQFLEQDLKPDQGSSESSGERLEMVELMLAQVERVQSTIERYRRLADVEPKPQELDINRLVTELAAMARAAHPTGITVETELSAQVRSAWVDQDLVTNALDNLIQNSLEAMQTGGTLRLVTFLEDTALAARVHIRVTDTGCGMDVRLAERVFDEFQTTKADGSGLGLAFVRRVAEVHGGIVTLETELERGTSIELVLPVEGPTRV